MKLKNRVLITGGAGYIGSKLSTRLVELGFNVTVHQNQVIGSYSMIGMSSVITKKIKIKPGYIFAGNPAKKISINKVGIKKKKYLKMN